MKNDHIDLKSNQNIFITWKFSLLLLYAILFLHIMFIIPQLHLFSFEFNSRQFNWIWIQLNLNSIQWIQIEFMNLNPNSKSSCMQWHSIFPQNEFFFHQIFIVMVMQNNVEPKGDKGPLKLWYSQTYFEFLSWSN